MIQRFFLLVSVLFILVGCSKPEQKITSEPGGGAARLEYTDLSDIPSELRSQFESFAKQFQDDLRAGETNAIRTAFDRPAIADAICDGIQAAEGTLNSFKTGAGIGAVAVSLLDH